MMGRFGIFKKLVPVLGLCILWLSSGTLHSQDKVDTLVFSDAYLDTVKIEKVFRLNDYTMIGVEGGVSMCRAQFNPSKTQSNLFVPGTYGIFMIKYGKLFDGSANFGIKFGLRFCHEGYKFKENEDTGVTPNQDGAVKAIIDVVDIPVMAHFHSDGQHFKIMADLGIFGGRRMDIERYGDMVDESIRKSFAAWDRRLDFGLTGGLGFGLVFDPLEFHFNAGIRYSWGTLFDADYYSREFYRFAYPIDFVFTGGVYFQLSRRTGRGKAQLRREAYQQVYHPKENAQ